MHSKGASVGKKMTDLNVLLWVATGQIVDPSLASPVPIEQVLGGEEQPQLMLGSLWTVASMNQIEAV